MNSEITNDISYNFHHKTVFITGGSRGIGRAIATLFAQSKASLVITEIGENYAALESFAKELEEAYGSKVHTFLLDVRKTEHIEKVVEEAIEAAGPIDILVNNAGINSLNRATQITVEEWDNLLNINLRGTFFVTQAVGKTMITQRKGSIVSIASQHGVVGNEMRAHYCSSKAGIINMSRALSYEWADYGIRVNTVSPTFVITENNEEFLNDRSIRKKYLSKVPIGKYAHAEDIAYAVAFLSSSGAKMITGHNLIVDGGWTAI